MNSINHYLPTHLRDYHRGDADLDCCTLRIISCIERNSNIQNEVQVSVDPHVKSDDLVAVGDRRFSLDAVLDSKSSQEDAFQSVGAPMVKSAMAGYNTLVLAYGQAMMLLTHISHLDSARLSLYVRLNLLC
ncbi:hypothetical protein R6Q59_004180 [Mikania micrantha]|uniref:Kinesin motor domain-containing protein n=1 Tax=Mikania micrantha TaxID=192012 RepID=A0A5N6MN27_9ASTR|nr:hypothetical protein E3N88_30787 [Mikania micrantha]